MDVIAYLYLHTLVRKTVIAAYHCYREYRIFLVNILNKKLPNSVKAIIEWFIETVIVLWENGVRWLVTRVDFPHLKKGL